MIDFINKYGIYSVMLTIALEYACFPLPSEVLLPLSGMILKSQGYNYFFVVFTSSIAGVIGILICYILGRILGYKILLLIVKKFPSTCDSLEKTRKKYIASSRRSVLVGRIIPVCRTYISFFSGIYKQRVTEFILYSFIGIFIWNAILISIGYFFQNKIDINVIYNNYKIIILAIIAFYIIVNIIKKEVRKKATISD